MPSELKPTTREEREEWRQYHRFQAPSKIGHRVLRLIADVERLETLAEQRLQRAESLQAEVNDYAD